MGVKRIGFLALLFLVSACAHQGGHHPSTYEVYWSSKGIQQAHPLVYPRLLPDSTRLHMPPRYHEVILPVWIPGYVTPDGDYIQEHYIYVIVRKSTWFLEGFPLGADPLIPPRP